jgi:CRISPR-associated protein Cmr6
MAERPPTRPPELPLPRALARFIPPRPLPGDNLGLWIDRFLRRRAPESLSSPGEHAWSFKEAGRADELRALTRAWTSQAGDEALQRREEWVDDLPGHIRLLGRQEGPLLINHGVHSASEVAALFHPLWGVPRIPGSSLRGVARRALQADADRIFGTTEEAGTVDVLDALPLGGSFSLGLDVLTPHHKEWYEGPGKKDWDKVTLLPTDDASPVPVTFLVVHSATFVIDLVPRSRGAADDVARVAEALEEALEWEGVGAKTSAGYGRLRVERA